MCSSKPEPKKGDIVKVDGKKYEVVKHDIDTEYVKVTQTIVKKGKDIIHDVPVYVNVPVNVDTNAILKDYYAKYCVKDTLRLKLKLLQDELKLLEKGSDDYNAKLVEIESTKTEIRKKGEEDRKKITEERLKQEKLAAEAEKARLEAQLDKARKGFEEASKKFDDTTKSYEETRDKGLKAISDENSSLEERKQVLEYYYQNKLITEKDYSDASIKIQNIERENKIKGLNITANALNSFAELAGKNTAAGKALAIASTTISTYVAAQEAYASAVKIPYVGAILAPIAAAAAVAAGLANIKAILAVQVPGGGGNNASSLPSLNAAPAPIIRPSSNLVRLGNEPINTNSVGEKTKVYVLESDITSTQKNVDSIRQKATIK